MRISFDEYLSERIGVGKGQYLSFFIISMIEFMDGFQEVFQALLVRILKSEWNISGSQQMLLGSLFFAGNMVGNMMCSVLADKYGRKLLLVSSQLISIAMMLANSYAQNYTEVAITIFFYGLNFGISMPVSQVMVSEIAPTRVRGIFIVLQQFLYLFGILYLLGNCVYFLESFDRGDWRNLLRVNLIPSIVFLLLSILFLRDSPRLFIAQGQFEKGFIELDKMGRLNSSSYQPITEEEKNGIILWRNHLMEADMEQRNFQGLFQGGNLKVTCCLWAIYILFNIIACGLTVITPYLYNDSEATFIDMLFAYSCEIPAILLVLAIFENEFWGGRIKCTIYGLVVLIGIQIPLYIFQAKIIRQGQMVIRFGCRIVWSCLNALPTESYSTVYRSMGVGAAEGVGKITGSAASFMVLPLYYYSAYLPFLAGAIMAFFCLIIMIFYPVNATQKPLDLRSTIIVQHQVESEETANASDTGKLTDPLNK